MKKVISILLVLVAAAGFAFATTDATLNLTTTVNGAAEVKIVSGALPATASDFDNATDLNSSTAQTVSTEAATYAFAVKTNATSLAQVTLVANPLANGTNAYIKYSVAAGSNTSTATNAAGDSIVLMSAISADYAGTRVEGATFTVTAIADGSIDSTNHVFGYDVAPNGTYTGSVVITYTAV